MRHRRRELLLALLGAATGRPRDTAAQDALSRATPPALPPPETTGSTVPVAVDDAELTVFIEGRRFAVGVDGLGQWVARSARIVADYYDGFPIPAARVNLRGVRGARVANGRAMPERDGVVLTVFVGIDAKRDALDRDWVLIHELIHLAFPSVHRRHQWLTEGLATYVESIARAQAGALTDEQVWRGFLDGMPQGLPRAGDKGLDYTPTWGRTYWGGALFCLLADVQIRADTGNARSLQDGLRAITAAGYNMMRVAKLGEVLAIADGATGVPVLTRQYEAMRDQPLPTEIDSLWAQLGVARAPAGVRFDDSAPLAGIRRSLTRRPD